MILGSARVSPSRTFLAPRNDQKSRFKESLFRRDTETNTRDACATREGRGQRPRLQLLRAFFEGGGFATQMGENFAGKMERAGDQNRIWIRPRKHQCFTNR